MHYFESIESIVFISISIARIQLNLKLETRQSAIEKNLKNLFSQLNLDSEFIQFAHLTKKKKIKNGTPKLYCIYIPKTEL